MFWGLILEPNKRYTQTVDKPFHISQAAMDTSTGDNEVCQVMVIVDKKNYLICTLQKGKNIQLPLDLYFKTGETISFLTNGKCNIHMTGYLDPEFEEEPENDDSEDDEQEDVPELVQAGKKRQLEVNNVSANKKVKLEQSKKAKSKKAAKEEDSDDESDGEDDLKRLLDGEISSDDNDDSFNVNTTAEADSDEEEEEEDDDSEDGEEEQEDDESEEEKVEKVAPPPPQTQEKLSKNQKRKLKKLQKQQAQVNGVEKKEKQEKSKEAQNNEAKSPSAEKKSLSGGVMIEDLQVGSGPIAKPGKVVQVYYEGKLKQNNKKFDSCQKGPGFKFRLGSKEVISGWDVGVSGMKVGGKRRIVCPPAMAYGAKGSPPVIPPNSTLVFEVELKNVK